MRAHVRREIHGYGKDELADMLTDMLDLLDTLEAELQAIRDRDLQKRTMEAMESLSSRIKKGSGEN